MGYSRKEKDELALSDSGARRNSWVSRRVRNWRWLLLVALILLFLISMKQLVAWLLAVPPEEEIPQEKLQVHRPERQKVKHAKAKRKVWTFEYPYDFGEIFSDKENWRMSKENFTNAFRRVAFEVSSSVDSDLYVFDLKGLKYWREDVQEARVRFALGGKSISRIELVLYGRGNCSYAMPWFEMERIWKRILDMRDDEEDTTEMSFRDYGDLGRVDIGKWFGLFPAVECWFGYKQICEKDQWETRPNYITVQLSCKKVKRFKYNDLEGFVSIAGYARDGLRKGDVFIRSVPMVDQGQRGYCSVATMERIMRYFGTDVYMHEFAMLADSDKDKGTNTAKLQKGLDRVCEKFGMSWTQNVAAASLELSIARYAQNEEAIRAIRKDDVAGFTQFTNEVMASIDRGLPVFWTVNHLLSSPEDFLKKDHARLILGYNQKTLEFLFSDTWGAQHEFKRKKMLDSWIMTDTAFTVDPASRKDLLKPEDGLELQVNE